MNWLLYEIGTSGLSAGSCQDRSLGMMVFLHMRTWQGAMGGPCRCMRQIGVGGREQRRGALCNIITRYLRRRCLCIEWSFRRLSLSRWCLESIVFTLPNPLLPSHGAPRRIRSHRTHFRLKPLICCRPSGPVTHAVRRESSRIRTY